MTDAGAVIEELVVADDPATWRRLGFAVARDVCTIGSVRVRLAGRDAGQGIVSWTVRGLTSDALDGVPTTLLCADEPTSAPEDDPDAGTVAATGLAVPHPNGSVRIDHVVVVTPDLDRTTEAMGAAGLRLRRVRDVPGGPLRQAFYRLGDVILEVAGPIPSSPAARFWGLTCVTEDLDAAKVLLGDDLGLPKDAVQRGRRIATVSRAAGSTVPLAFITP